MVATYTDSHGHERAKIKDPDTGEWIDFDGSGGLDGISARARQLEKEANETISRTETVVDIAVARKVHNLRALANTLKGKGE